MSARTLNEIFDQQANSPPIHPRLRHWDELIAQGAQARLEVFRPETSLGQVQSEMNLHFSQKDRSPVLETVPWDDVFNAGLIERHVRAVDTTNEAERFALGLRAALRKAEREFGDGYFNSVLYEFVTESDLTRYPDINDIIKHAHAIKPNHGGRGYNDCRELIAAAIVGRKYELETFLGYGTEEARAILVKALSKYLDERYSVSNRRRLGLL